MDSVPFTRTFHFNESETCKRSWTFTLRRQGADLIIEDLHITDDLRSDGKIQGCHGHPKTIVVLIKGRSVASIDAEALALAACPRDKACGQALAECLNALRTNEASA